ncbi:transforming growth factor beta regulator 1 [Ambystoma mexicanum]|uniref:transforming growth factor beta regulator 1 n=1 Tax=Ambystoma mexicanum TaxID=8296 RepID=UPI0037E858C9
MMSKPSRFPALSDPQDTKPKMRKLLKKSQNEKYRIKYLRLRKVAKAMVFENAAVCDEAARLEEKFVTVKEERRCLLTRLLQLQALHKAESQTPTCSTGGGLPPGYGATGTLQENLGASADEVEEGTGKKPKREKKERVKESARTELFKHSKKRAPDGGARKLVQPIALDPCGRPIFPIVLGGLTVYSLGEIISDRAGFHDETAIYPVGFCSTRVFVSLRNPDQQCLYTCQIKDGVTGPQFEIAPEDDQQNAIVASSANDCHAQLLEAISRARGRPHTSVVPSGEDFFGFSHPTIQNLIQSCPGARKCATYQWVRFEVCRPGDGQIPQGLSENDASTNFEAFQRQAFQEDRDDLDLSGVMDLSKIHSSQGSVSTYQQMFLSDPQMASSPLVPDMKSPRACSPGTSSE